MARTLKNMSRVVAIAALTLPLAATAVRADEAADQAAIQEMWKTYESLVVAGDGATWMGLYDPEGIQLPPGKPMLSYDELAEAVKAWTPDDADAMSIMPIETVILGDMAWSMGTYTIDYTTADGPGQIDGKFMTLLRRQDDGSWGIYRDIFNMNTQ